MKIGKYIFILVYQAQGVVSSTLTPSPCERLTLSLPMEYGIQIFNVKNKTEQLFSGMKIAP